MFLSILFVKREVCGLGLFFFLFQNTSTTTLKLLDLLFVLQPTQHGLMMCKCCQKVEVTQSKFRKQQDFAGGTGLMKLCSVLVSCHPRALFIWVYLSIHVMNNI